MRDAVLFAPLVSPPMPVGNNTPSVIEAGFSFE